jgi:hypothetical protein
VQTRYANAWADAISAEAAGLERRRIERGYRRLLALTDEVLGRLEERNMAGERNLDQVVRRHIARTLDSLPPRARARFRNTNRVQEALDGIFEVQEELMLVLQRMLHWDRLLADQPLERRTA